MSIYEVKMWRIRCDGCSHEGPTVMSQGTPTIPADWSNRVAHDCGMTGYSATRIYCPECTQRRTNEAS